jgi:hypothetical protein
VEEILECLYSFSEHEDGSEEDCDKDAAEELALLEVTNSGNNERDGAFAVAWIFQRKYLNRTVRATIHQKTKVNGAITSNTWRI